MNLKLRLRWPVLGLWSLVFAIFVSAAATVSFSTDYTIFFADDDPDRMAFLEMESRFAQTDNFVFVIHTPENDVFHPKTLALVERITREAEDIPFARRVDSLANFPRAISTEDDIEVRALTANPSALTEIELSEIRDYASGEPLLVGGLLSEDLHATGVVVTLELPREDAMEVRESTVVARAILDRARENDSGAEVRLSGLAAMNDAFMGVSIDDLMKVAPIMYLVMLLLLLVLLRSKAATAAVVVVVTVSSTAALAVAGFFGIPLTPPSASAPTIVMTLAIADCVHLYVATRHARAQGLVGKAAVWAGLRETWRPIVLTSVTTIAGFLALNFAESAPFWHLGNMAAVGIFVAMVASLSLFPALLTFMDVPALRSDSKFSSTVRRAASFGLAHPVWCLAVGMALTVVGAASMTRLVSNEDFVRYFDEDVAFRKDTDFLVEHLTGIYSLDYVLDSGAPDGVFEPNYIAALDGFASWLRLQPEVRNVQSFSDLLLGASEGFTGERVLPDSREFAAQTLLMYEMSLPAGRDLRSRLDADRQRTRLSATVGDLSAQELQSLERRSEEWLLLNAPRSMRTEATSPVMIFSKLTTRNTALMLKGNLATLFVISLLLLVLLRRKRIAIASIIPNLAPMLVAYGAWALLVEEIGIVGSVAGSVCLGIIVDDTIHVLTRYERFRAQGFDVDDSLQMTLDAVAPALMTTSLVLSAGFFVLTFSSFQMNVHLGALTAAVIALALVADLFFLPALIRLSEHVGAPVTRTQTKENTMSQRTLSFLKILFAVSIVLVATPAQAQSNQRGEALAQQVAQRTGGFGDFEAQLSMEVASGSTARRLRLRALETDDGTHSLIIFDGPADVRGTALLSRQDGDEQEQWLYLPAMRRSRRVAGGQLSAAFLGSEFAFEDISGISTDRYSWSLIGEAPCARGTSEVCHKLESRPRFEGSGYAKRVVYVDKEHLRVFRVEHFDQSGARIKTLVNSQWREHSGRFWRAHRWVMTNHQNSRSTTVNVSGYEFGNGLSERDFTRNALGRVR